VKSMLPAQKPWFLVITLSKGGLKPDLYPRPPDLHQNVLNINANIPGKSVVPGKSLRNPFSGRIFHPFPPCPPGHLPPQTECAGVLRCI